MTVILDRYIEIKNLTNPEKVFNRMENAFIDIMYEDHFTENSVIILLDVGFDPYKEKTMDWLKGLLEGLLTELGETNYSIVPFESKLL